MTEQEKEELDSLVTGIQVDGSLWQPHPENKPQQDGYNTKADILYFGGQAGGGKTDLGIGTALTKHRKSIIFRREYPQLKDIISRCIELIGHDKGLNKNEKVWNLGDGKSLEFGAVQYEDDVNKYRGRPHDLKVFDEIPEFTEYQFRFLIGWLRTTTKGQRTRIICTGNPPTSPEGEWVIKFWGPWLDPNHPHPAQPGELRWYAMVDGEEIERPDGQPFEHNEQTIKPMSRTFIPASVYDNPYLRETEYVTVLQSLPEPLRSMLLEGKFDVRMEDDPWQIIPTYWIELAQERWTEQKPDIKQTAIGIDVAQGGKDQTVFSKRYSNWYDKLVKYPGMTTPDGSSVATLLNKEIEGEPAINIDVTGGWGNSAYEILEHNEVPNINGVNFAEGSSAVDRTGRYKFRNRRAEIWWMFREALDPEFGDDIALPPDSELKADLRTPRYKITISGIQVESKEDIKKRIKRSPDCGEAVILASLDEGGVEIIGMGQAMAQR